MEDEKKKLDPEKLERVEKLIDTLLKETRNLKKNTIELKQRLDNIVIACKQGDNNENNNCT